MTAYVTHLEGSLRPANCPSRCVIFDADDTLWSTQELYESVKDEFYKLLQRYGVSRDELAARLDAIDAASAQRVGFVRDRFSSSLQVTYEELCREAHISSDSAVLEYLFELGQSVFEHAPILYPDTHKVLSMLKSEHLLVMLTKGDTHVQQKRIATSGLASYFDLISIVSDKNSDTYRNLLNVLKLPPKCCWAVGNSARSDINPALELGIPGIMIPNRSWIFEFQNLIAGDVVVLPNLTEAATYILKGDDRDASEKSPLPSNVLG